MTGEAHLAQRLKPVKLFDGLIGKALERRGRAALGGRGNAAGLVDQQMKGEPRGIDAEARPSFGGGEVNRQARPRLRHDRPDRCGPRAVRVHRHGCHREPFARLEPRPQVVKLGQVRARVR